jgi:hypothetical protein
MTRITRAGRGAWLAAGLILAAVLYPVGANAVRGAHAVRAHIATAASEIKTAEGNPANWIVIQAANVGGCRQVYTVQSGRSLLLRSGTVAGDFTSDAAYAESQAQLQANGPCDVKLDESEPGPKLSDPDVVVAWGTNSVAAPNLFNPGFVAPSGTTIYVRGEESRRSNVYLSGFLVPSSAAPTETQVVHSG